MSAETIFEQNAPLKASEDLMSFEGCPNQCRHGFYVDPYRHKRVRCEYCFDLRKKLARNAVSVGDDRAVGKLLHLDPSFMGYGNFESGSLWTKYALRALEPGSVKFVGFVMQRLIEQVSLGEPLGASIVLNLGKNARSQNFIAPFLVRSYISGLSTAPLVTGLDVSKLRAKELGALPDGHLKKYAGLWYSDILETDTCLVYLDADSGVAGIKAAKGLMQLRALQARSTVVLTDAYEKELHDMCTDHDELQRDYIARNTEAQNVALGNRIVTGEFSHSKDLALYISVHLMRGKREEDVDDGKRSVDQSSLLAPVGSVGTTR